MGKLLRNSTTRHAPTPPPGMQRRANASSNSGEAPGLVSARGVAWPLSHASLPFVESSVTSQPSLDSFAGWSKGSLFPAKGRIKNYKWYSNFQHV